MITLSITKRDLKTKLEDIREAGNIPAVFYGRKEASTPITLLRNDFLKVWREAGESSVIQLKGDGFDIEALIQDVDLDPVTSVVRHADFYAIEKGKKLEVDVPLEFVGVAPAVKDLGGILVKVLHDLEIEALPKDLPHNVKIDISVLTTLDSQILAKDVILPAGVTLITKPDEVVASITEPVEEPVESAPIDLSKIEVEKKGKEAKEGAEGAEAPAAK